MNSIRSELNALIVGVARSRDTAPVGLFLIFGTILFAFVGAASAELFAIWLPSATWLFRSLAVIWIGIRMRALGNMMHECSHGIFADSSKGNEKLGHLLAALDLASFSDYSHQHASHHAHLGDPERDLDFRSRFFLLGRNQSAKAILLTFFISVLLVPLWFIMLRPVLWARCAPLWSNFIRIVLLTGVVLAAIHPETQLLTLLYVIVPYLTTYQWMRIFSDACDHLFLTQEIESYERSRNHLFKHQFLNVLLFPRHDAYHLLHHLFPALPTRLYPNAHAQLLQHPWYRSRQHELRIFRKNKSIEEHHSFAQGQSR